MTAIPSDSRTPAESRTGARMIALGLAMKAMLGVADDRTLSLAVIATREALGDDDPLTVDVRQMARDWQRIRYQSDRLLDAGNRLFRAVQRSCWPAPSGRADLDG